MHCFIDYCFAYPEVSGLDLWLPWALWGGGALVIALGMTWLLMKMLKWAFCEPCPECQARVEAEKA